jgi:hypothetical protein
MTLTRRQIMVRAAAAVTAAAMPAVAQAKGEPMAAEHYRLMLEFRKILMINSHSVDVRTLERLANAAMSISQ